MRVLEWRQTARADLLAIIDYISDDNPDAALRLKQDIDVKLTKLLAHPRLYRTGTREMIVRANYLIVYTEDERTVGVLRVLHAARQWPPEQD